MSRSYRKERLDELFLNELDTMLTYELNDPGLDGIAVSRVDVTRDLQAARIYVTLLEPDVNNEAEVMAALERARGYIRSELAARIQLRRMPELIFRIDRLYEQSRRVEAILETLEYASENNESPDANPEPST
ncbi:MAG: 30S ribosome-binding factor RbfA [Chloroflexi bacterium]|nr:30S ribosome-binding factor RbfA [Chloroflexota bacterium]